MVFVVHSPPTARRRFLGGAAALSLAGPARLARAADGRRILIIGDSYIAGGFGRFLARDLQQDHGFTTIRHGKPSSGLARPDFFDWPQMARALVAEHGVCDATVIMVGGNDVQGLYMGKGAWIRYPDARWPAEYARRVVALCDIVAPDGQQIFWVGMPVMGRDELHTKVQRVNWICRAEMAIRPCARFIDTWRVLADEDGEYTDRLPPTDDPTESKRRRGPRIRAADGVHFAPAGSRRLADHVLAAIVETMKRRATP